MKSSRKFRANKTQAGLSIMASVMLSLMGLRIQSKRLAAFAAMSAWIASQCVEASGFTATLDRESLTVGESATLTLTFEGQPKSIPSLQAIPNLQFTSPQSSRNISIVNGQVSYTTTQTYELTPTQPGDFVIPALQAEVDGQLLSSHPLKLKALKTQAANASAPTGDQLAFMKLSFPKKEVYVGEVFAVEVQLYIRDGIVNAENILQSFEAFNGTPIKAEGFSVLKTARAQRRRARAGNATYSVATLVTSLTPVKTGPLTLGSIDITLPLQLPAPNQRRDPFFDPFGMFQQYQEKRLSLSAETNVLSSLSLPKENIPPNFNGAVGNFTMTISAGPTNVAIGDPITVKIQISGHGAFDSLNLPAQPAWRDFNTYPPTTRVDTTDALGLEGSKTFEQVVVPQSADIKELPTVSFSYFDSDQKSYRTLSHEAIPLIVRPSGAAPPPTVVAAARGTADNQPPAQDIVDIKQRLGTLAQIGRPLIARPWFVGLQSVPVLAWVCALVWRRRSDMLANNPRLRRQRRVAQIIRDGLVKLRQHATAKDSDQFFVTLFHLLQEQLGERLDLPATAITEAVIEENLRPGGVAEPTLIALQEIFQVCNLARFAPIKTSQELAELINKSETVLRELQGLKL
jgi:hypothetical protein